MRAPATKRDVDWTQEQIDQYKRILPRYQQFAQALREVLEEASHTHAHGAIIQVRTKAISSFAEKIQRKKAKYHDPLHQITDLCGGRVITRTPADVRAMCQFIEEHFEIDWSNSIDVSQRLKPTEFGYRSVHYIVRFQPGVFPSSDINCQIPESVFGLKAEIQVRTILEHAWADFNHRLVYKSPFPVPTPWLRETAGLAAMLERADNAFAQIAEGLTRYATDYGTYMTKEQMQDEIEILRLVLEYDPHDAKLAHRIGKLAIALGEWQTAVDLYRRFLNTDYQPILRDLGFALCMLYRQVPTSSEYQQGQQYLESACAACQQDAAALAYLADTWRGIDDDQARRLYRQAFETDPTDPFTLGRYLEHDLAQRQDTDLLSYLDPVIEGAIEKCRDQISVGVNLPWALYDIGKLALLRGQADESLDVYVKAIHLTTDNWPIEAALESLDRLAVVQEDLEPGYDWACRILLLGQAAKFETSSARERIASLALSSDRPINRPVVIVAGGASLDLELDDYQGLAQQAFLGFRGTVVSGGTTSGICGLIGEVQKTYAGAVHTIGYVPRERPAGVELDERYRELRITTGADFSPLEPLQYWIDLLAAGIQPSQVKLIGIGGGAIAAAEYRIALALGATVAIIQDSGREAGRLLGDEDWNTLDTLFQLPPDGLILRAFIGSDVPRPKLGPRETIAQAIHEAYRAVEIERRAKEDQSLVEWDKLLDSFKESNRQQADDILEKLRQVGCGVYPADSGEAALIEFNEPEIEKMAQMEHARWAVERIRGGWVWGPERDTAHKINPLLVPWSALSEEVKERNRKIVRRIPGLLAQVGLEIRREGQEEK